VQQQMKPYILSFSFVSLENHSYC